MMSILSFSNSPGLLYCPRHIIMILQIVDEEKQYKGIYEIIILQTFSYILLENLEKKISKKKMTMNL